MKEASKMAKSYKNFKQQLHGFARDFNTNGKERKARNALLDDFDSAESLSEQQRKLKSVRKMRDYLEN